MEEEEKPAVEPEKRQSSCLLSAQTMPSLPASSHGSKPLPSYASLVPVESSRLDSTGRQGSGPPIPPKSSRRQPTNTTVVVTYPDNSSPNALLTDLGHQELTTVRCLESGRLTGDQLYWMAHENEKLRVANEAVSNSPYSHDYLVLIYLRKKPNWRLKLHYNLTPHYNHKSLPRKTSSRITKFLRR